MRALLVHGLSSDSTSWWSTSEALEGDGWDVHTVDLRGHGLAGSADSYSLADYAGDLSGNWDLVVGHSLGGAVAVLAAQRTGFAGRLVLLDPVLDVAEDEFDEILADQLSELDLTAESIAELKPHWHERDREAKLSGIQHTNAYAVEHTFTDTGRWNVASEAASLTIPTLILSGDHAVYSMLAASTVEELRAANPLVDYVIIDGAGHSPHRDKPEATFAALRDWLAQQ